MGWVKTKTISHYCPFKTHRILDCILYCSFSMEERMRSSRSTPAGEFPVRIPGANGLIQAVRYFNFRSSLKG